MTTDLETLIRTGLREYADAPVINPPPIEAVVDRRPRRSLRPGELFVPVLAAAAVLLVVVLATAVVPTRDGIGIGTGSAKLAQIPSTFAPFSFLTGDLVADPIEQAVAAYVQRNDGFEGWGQDTQLLLLDADGVRYRRTHVADPVPARFGHYQDGIGYQPFLLSPDGRRVAIGGGPTGRRDLAVLDVATGAVTRFEVTSGANVRPLAWSPDGHRIAYVTTTAESGLGPLTIFDIVTGTDDPHAGSVSAVAFSPDGSRLAVEENRSALDLGISANQITVVGSDPPETFIQMAKGERIAGSGAWSPDGQLLALIKFDDALDSNGGHYRQTRGLTFLNVGDPARPVPADIPLDPSASFQGWRGDSVVVWDGVRLVAIPVHGGTPTTLAETGSEVSAVQVAYGLLSTATVVEPGPVDRGPWPRWARFAVGIPVGVVSALGIGWWLTRRRTRWSSAQLST